MAHFRTNNLFASAMSSNYPPEDIKKRVVLAHIIEGARRTRGVAATHHLAEGDTLTKGQVILLKQLNQRVYICDQDGWFYWDIDDELNLFRIPKEEDEL